MLRRRSSSLSKRWKGALVSPLTGAGGGEDQQTDGWLMADEIRQKVEAGGICPLQVIEQEQDGLILAQVAKERGDGFIETEARLFGREVVEGGEFTETLDEFGKEGRQHMSVGARLAAQLRLRGSAHDFPQRFEEGQVRRHAFGLEAMTAHHPRPFRLVQARRLCQQVTLPHARLAGEQDERGSSPRRVLEFTLQRGQFSLSAD